MEERGTLNVKSAIAAIVRGYPRWFRDEAESLALFHLGKMMASGYPPGAAVSLTKKRVWGTFNKECASTMFPLTADIHVNGGGFGRVINYRDGLTQLYRTTVGMNKAQLRFVTSLVEQCLSGEEVSVALAAREAGISKSNGYRLIRRLRDGNKAAKKLRVREVQSIQDLQKRLRSRGCRWNVLRGAKW